MSERMPVPASSPWLLHWPKPTEGACVTAAEAATLAHAGLYLDTCLRQLIFGRGEPPASTTVVAPEFHTGVDAWRLMLEIVCGLRSAVPGETNIFGQFRAAWREASRTLRDHRRRLIAPQVEALIADARAVRARHLQGIGGSSYGSLARRLLSTEPGGRLLFVGAGELTRSMLPLFAHCEVGVWNRREVPGLPAHVRVFRPEARHEAAVWAHQVVFTTPPDDRHDGLWDRALAHGDVKALLHLGRRHADRFDWSFARSAARSADPSRLWDLDDLFELARTRESVRSLQLVRAKQACAELAAARWGCDAAGAAQAANRRRFAACAAPTA